MTTQAESVARGEAQPPAQQDPTAPRTGGGNAMILIAAAAVGVGVYALTRTPATTPAGGTSGPGTSGPGTSGPGTSGPGTSGPGTSGTTGTTGTSGTTGTTGPSPTTTALTADNNTGWQAGQILVLTATVRCDATGPTGWVTFSQDDIELASVAISPWSASVSTSIQSGSHSYRADFHPTNHTAPSSSAPVLVTAQAAPVPTPAPPTTTTPPAQFSCSQGGNAITKNAISAILNASSQYWASQTAANAIGVINSCSFQNLATSPASMVSAIRAALEYMTYRVDSTTAGQWAANSTNATANTFLNTIRSAGLQIAWAGNPPGWQVNWPYPWG